MKKLMTIILLLFLASPAFAGDFTLGFNWDGLRKCTNGKPNTVGNPAFTLSNVPAGTKWLYFELTDIDVPNYRHGGGWIEYTGGNVTEAGVFNYKSPCPPNGSHTYEWRVTATAAELGVTATAAKGPLKGPLGTATSRLDYPD